MIFNTIGIGGASLNFEIVGGTSQPSNPKANTLWVNTDLDFDSWVFDVSAPSNLGTNGIWIKLGSSSPIKFNVLNENYIMLCPIGIYQWVGTWANLTNYSMFWDGEKWIAFSMYLFSYNDHHTEVTGGWSGVDSSSSVINLSYSNKQNADASINSRTNNMIDVTDYNSLIVTLDEINESFTLSLVDNSGKKIASAESHSAGNISIDIRNINGSYYVDLSAYAGSHGDNGDNYVSVYFTVSEVKLL